MKKILIIGATSAIAQACAKEWAPQAEHLFLAGRNTELLKQIGDNLHIKHDVHVTTHALDFCAISEHQAMLDRAQTVLSTIDLILIAHGTLSNQEECQQSVTKTLEEIQTNATSTIALLTLVANLFEKQGKGCIAVISSVAGDRGRKNNYVYGSAKAMVSAFMSGLRQRLSHSGVQVLTIKPGFVDTPMTTHFKKSKLWATPEKVAQDIDHAVRSGQDTLYTPWFWMPIMSIIKLIPERIFKKLSI
jgi:decaprenylphospho-beta-D-erythro-pentofuranosid-2-ulose 2-reductase